MEQILQQTLLYDFYGELLTEHQRNVYEQVVLNDLSYSEAAAELGISRQGVHELIKRCNKILKSYEERLHHSGECTGDTGAFRPVERRGRRRSGGADSVDCRENIRGVIAWHLKAFQKSFRMYSEI